MSDSDKEGLTTIAIATIYLVAYAGVLISDFVQWLRERGK